MSTQSSIEWTDTTWNPVRGCAKVSPGCTNCYAMRQAHRFSGKGAAYEGLTHVVKGKGPQWTGALRTVPELLEQPLRWRKPRRVFVNSMSDLFHEGVPFEFIDRVFAVMALAPRHTFQILTKRPERMAEYFDVRHGNGTPRREGIVKGRAWEALGYLPKYEHHDVIARAWPLPNVWLGASVEDQAAADARIPHLLRTPAAVRFLSCEPLLGPLDFTPPQWRGTNVNRDDWLQDLHWVIAGGESGPGARPCGVAWTRAIVRACQGRTDMGRPWPLPVFVKQLGARPYMTGPAFAASLSVGVECEHGYDNCPRCDAADVPLQLRDPKGGDPSEWPEDLRVREFPRPLEAEVRS